MSKVKKFVDPQQFEPFKRYLENRDALTKHIAATDLAYALAVCDMSDNRLKGTDSIESKKATSYSNADFGVGKATRLYGWVTAEIFAELEHLATEEVRTRMDRGEFGKVERHPVSNEKIVIWPTSKCGSPEAEALKLGKSQFSVKGFAPGKVVGVALDTEDESSLDQARGALLYLGRSLGQSESVYTEARELFYRGSLLNLWSSFEIFIKDSFGELIRRFPLSLAALPDWKKLSLSYADLVLQTDGLQSISSLRETLIGAEIAKAETGGRSVSGLINVLKSLFDWPSDLYQRPYYDNGVSQKTGFFDLNEIREVRNALAHSNSQKIEVLNKSIRLKLVDDRPVIDKEYLDWAEIVLSAIAHGISEDVVAGRVSVSEVT
jgi:hypothetical protein